ncbi:bis(5'-nucleosyl)-tetraphosphatase (symmetrical) YqeK [Streptococcus cuniculipharyngis]|uniref:bis(5'-nucleosyl)-tetraphosphatase (symmetrical) n=1 Tax=Streptococcus cuniculipharyngis TaxID=1562651 RepID=A0A5C5SD20_9STRE|nr:bis(5'-nucleosyl)-tetraphosphatase (symmetrical) YqeK [Streptococcus cuniculipharyngis]TWS98182.1 HD domain-containing protein [Streptococcus cuniculipharyngis]
MTYADYVTGGRSFLLEKMAERLSPKRLAHCLRVEEASIDLAKRYGLDETKAGLAGLLHDYAKELADQDFLTLIDQHQLDPALKAWNNNVWHGLLGPYVIQAELGLTDADILQAIAYHTVGSSQMTDLDKVVYVADYIECGRDFPGVDQAREIAKISLNQAVAYETAATVAYLAQKGMPIYPQTLDTYNAYIHYL